MLGTCVKYYTNASPLGEDGTYGWSPNILGEFSHKANSAANYGVGIRHAAGAFAGSGENTNMGDFQVISTYTGPLIIYMNAHNSNSVYTDNGHVYPQSIALNFIIKT